MQAFQLLE